MNTRPIRKMLLRLAKEPPQRLFLYMGRVDIFALQAFVDGYAECVSDLEVPDPEWRKFFEWLRDVKREVPTEGWAAKFLRDCDGDQVAAIKKFFSYVTEYFEKVPDSDSGADTSSP